MRAKIVLGLGFGDEGKGNTTSYLCSHVCPSEKTIVVRFSGGQQAGHNVVMGNISHIFASFGSGTLAGCPTYLSEHCTFYPPNMLNEYNILRQKGVNPQVIIHPRAMCTTSFDVAYNRWREKIMKHGTCGIGVGATMKRNLQSPYKFYATDLLYPSLMDLKLKGIKEYYLREIAKVMIASPALEQVAFKEFLDIAKEEMVHFLNSMNSLVVQHAVRHHLRNYDVLKDFEWVVFEGSQGILLDMEHGVFPNVTYAHTTSKNAMEICSKIGIEKDNIEVLYVTRCYQTRHGAGWMSNRKNVALINNESEINTYNEWQKDFVTGELDYQLLNYALKCDSYSWGCDKSLVVTCLDQRPGFEFDYSKLDYTPHWWRIYESRSPKAELMMIGPANSR